MASDLATTLLAAKLAPSEMVLLFGERFTTAQVLLGRTGDPQIKLLHADVNVSAVQLGQAVLQAVFMANDRVGAIKLDPRKNTSLFGLSSEDSLFADPIGKAPNWPAGSWEAKIHAIAAQLQADKGKNEVYRIIAELLPESPEPWAAISGLVMDGLGSRNLLEAVPVVDEQILSTKEFRLTDEVRRLADEQSIGDIETLLSDYQSQQPEIWKRMTEQIKKAVQERTQA